MQNRRQFTRVLFSIKAELVIEDIVYPVSMHDISLSGALITKIKSTESVKGKTGILRFSLSDKKSEVSMRVTVIHQQPNETGLKCNTIDIDSITHLRRLIELNLGDSAQLTKELSQLSRII
jgi:hypothetical protein